MSIPTQSELIERARRFFNFDGDCYLDVGPTGIADLLDAEIRRAVREELEALREGTLTPVPGKSSPLYARGRETERVVWRITIDARLAALRQAEQSKVAAVSRVPSRVEEAHAELPGSASCLTDKPGATSRPGIDAERTQPANEPGSGRSAGADKGSASATAAMASATSPVCPGRLTTDPTPAVPCENGLTPDGPVCPRCGGARGPSGVDGGSWVHCPPPALTDAAKRALVSNANAMRCDMAIPALSDADVLERAAEILKRHTDPLRTRVAAEVQACAELLRASAAASAPKPVGAFEAFALGLGLRAQVRACDWFSPLVEALESAADQECEDKPSLDNWTCSGCWPCDAKKIISELRRKAQEAGQ